MTPQRRSGRIVGYLCTAEVSTAPGWLITFRQREDLRGAITDLRIKATPDNDSPELTTTVLREIVPAELIAATGSSWTTEAPPIVLPSAMGQRRRRTDDYFASLSERLIAIADAGGRWSPNVQLAVEFERTASQITDDVRAARRLGWIETPGRTQGRAGRAVPGPRLLEWREQHS